MTRTSKAALLIGLGLMTATTALAQSAREVPVEEDIRRHDRIEEKIDPRVAPKSSGQLPAQSDPSGVAGFNGPPGTLGDSVNNYGGLPQGVTGADIR